MTTVELRPVEPRDLDLLLRVYAGTRADELVLVDWPDGQKAAFVRQQFEAQDRHYREHYPTATFDVVLVDGEPAGRLYVERWTDEIRIMDVGLLPECRGRGVGTELLKRVQAEAVSSGRIVTIHVERLNPAQRLYRRLGFVPEDAGPVYLLMRWTPGPAT